MHIVCTTQCMFRCFTLHYVFLQVNLDFYTRDIISQSLQLPGPSCFYVAQKKIYSLMENDSFPRFIQSEQYKVLLEATSKQRGFTKTWKVLKMKSTRNLIQRDSPPISLSFEQGLT